MRPQLNIISVAAEVILLSLIKKKNKNQKQTKKPKKKQTKKTTRPSQVLNNAGSS